MSEFVNNMSSDSDSDSDYQIEFDYDDEDDIYFDEDNSTFNVLSATIDNGDYQSFVDFTSNDNPRFRGRSFNPDNPADEGGEEEMKQALKYIPSGSTSLGSTYFPLLHYILLDKGDGRVKDKQFLTHIVNLMNEFNIDINAISSDIYESPCQHAINQDNGNDAEWTQLYRNLLSCPENASKKKRKTRKKSAKKKIAKQKKKSVKKKHKSVKKKKKSAKKKTVNRHRCTKKRFKMNQICATGSKKKMKKLAKYSNKIKMKLTKCSKKRIKNIK